VDELRTSDDYLLEASRSADLYQITYSGHRTLVSRFLGFTEKALARQIGL
jgi:serine protease SohB